MNGRAAGVRRIPGCAPLRKDDGSVLLPERYSRFPCGLTPSAPAAAGFSRVQGNASPHVFSVLSLCTAVHDRKTIPYFAPMCKLFFHLMPHAPPECKAERPEPACRAGAFSADVRGFQLPPYCLRQQGPTLGSSAGETPAPQAKNTTAPGRRGIGSGRRGRQCLYQGREMA